MDWTVTALLLTVHLLLVDVAMIGPLLAVWFDWRSRREDNLALAEFGRRLAWLAIFGLVVGGILGGILLAVRYLSDERYFRALAAVPPARLWFAGVEWLFGLIGLTLYAALWRRWQRWRMVHGLVALASATNLLVHFPTLFIAVSVIGSRPGLAGEPLERAEYRKLLFDTEVLARVLHVWLAASAVTGLVVVWLALGKRPLPSPHEETRQTPADRCLKLGGRLAMTAVMLQFPVGLWVAMVMPEAARRNLMGHDAAATLLFLASVALAMLLMNLLSAVILGEHKRTMARRATVVLFVLVLLMVGVRLRSNRPADHRTAPVKAAIHCDLASNGLRPKAALASRRTSGSMKSPHVP